MHHHSNKPNPDSAWERQARDELWNEEERRLFSPAYQQPQALAPWQPQIEAPGPLTGHIPGGILDRASEDGGYVYAQETHFELVRDLFHANDIYVAMYRYDDEKGGKIDRKGYQDILQAAAVHRIKAVGVDTMARLGRDGPERLRALAELRHLQVPVYRADKKRVDEHGILQYVEAWQDEEYLYEQARKTLSNQPKVVAAGKHPAATPIGYRRVYPQLEVYDKRASSVLVPDPVYGPLVTQAFEDFSSGVSIRLIVESLNRGVSPNPASQDGRWSASTIYGMLQRKVYLGLVEWGKNCRGKYGRYQGPVLIHKGQHKALVEQEVWDRVQERLHGQRRVRGMNQRGWPADLLDGILLCRGCGGKVYARHHSESGRNYGQYLCAERVRGISECGEPSVAIRLADQAVLDQVARLRGRPWQPQAFDEVVRRDGNAPLRRRLRAELAAAEQELEQNTKAFVAAGDFSEDVAAAFRVNGRRISDHMQHVRDELAALPEQLVDTVAAKAIHERLQEREIGDLVAGAQARGDRLVARALVARLVSEARIVERGSVSGDGRVSTWMRAEVTWAPEVQLLLDAGLLTLGPAPELPAPKSGREMAAERARRYRARQREMAQ